METEPRESKKRKWQQLHEEFETLNQTVKEFCVERKVNINTFKDWRKKGVTEVMGTHDELIGGKNTYSHNLGLVRERAKEEVLLP